MYNDNIMSTCSVPECGGSHRALGYCNAHYRRFKKRGNTDALRIYADVCSMDGCESPHRSRGLCSLHYSRRREHGDVSYVPKVRVPHETFWSCVEKGLLPDDCWKWCGTTADGYGVFSDHCRCFRAHRYSFWLHNGYWPMPQCRHTCDNPPCTNPAHLKAGTIQDNMRDKVERGRQARGERQGHARLTRSDVERIRQYLAESYSMREIARRFAVSPTAIGKIKAGETWAAA